MVAVSVRNNRVVDSSMRINIEIPRGAIESSLGPGDQGGRGEVHGVDLICFWFEFQTNYGEFLVFEGFRRFEGKEYLINIVNQLYSSNKNRVITATPSVYFTAPRFYKL